HALTGVVHTAGVLDDGVFGALTAERLARVFAPKVTAVRHLDELTRELAPELRSFVLFSSAAGVFGSAGQGNYAAANAYLDALAHRRRADGLPAASLAWGLWEQAGGMAAHLTEADQTRVNRGGFLAIAPAEGLDLFDAGLRGGRAVTVPIKLDLRAVRAEAASGRGVLPLLRSLVPVGRRAVRTASGLADRLAGLAVAEQETLLLDLVRTHVATVLGHAGAANVKAETAFKDAGFDSLTSVQLRNRLREATGLSLPATVVFDYPTPLALAHYLHDRLDPSGEATATSHPLLVELSRLEAMLAETPAGDTARAQVATRLQGLLATWSTANGGGAAEEQIDYDTASDDELFDLIDTEFGS
ncbi:beta-ketoacyl reductase, partial [Kitasatospora sp. NPDC058263]